MKSPVIVLTASAGRTPWADVFPEGLHYGRNVSGQSKTVDLNVYLRHRDVGVASVVPDDGWLTVVKQRDFVDKNQKSRERRHVNVSVVLHADEAKMVAGDIASSVVVQSDKESIPSVQIPVRATIVPPVSIVPSRLRMEGDSCAKIIATSERGFPIEILSTNASELGMQVDAHDGGFSEKGVAMLTVVCSSPPGDEVDGKDLKIVVLEYDSTPEPETYAVKVEWCEREENAEPTKR